MSETWGEAGAAMSPITNCVALGLFTVRGQSHGPRSKSQGVIGVACLRLPGWAGQDWILSQLGVLVKGEPLTIKSPCEGLLALVLSS